MCYQKWQMIDVYQSVDKVALQARPSHCGRRQGAQPSPILRFGEGAQRSISTARAGRSPDGLFQRAAMPRTSEYVDVNYNMTPVTRSMKKPAETSAGFFRRIFLPVYSDR